MRQEELEPWGLERVLEVVERELAQSQATVEQHAVVAGAVWELAVEEERIDVAVADLEVGEDSSAVDLEEVVGMIVGREELLVEDRIAAGEEERSAVAGFGEDSRCCHLAEELLTLSVLIYGISCRIKGRTLWPTSRSSSCDLRSLIVYAPAHIPCPALWPLQAFVLFSSLPVYGLNLR